MLFSNNKKASTKVKINSIKMVCLQISRCFNRTITLELSKSIAIMRTSVKYLLDINACLKIYFSQYMLLCFVLW